ncbi:MAG TPA: hypothetical protein VGN82_03535 [Bosea sp. (in: a-proteobacteria)]|jgi:hypothetical protein|uniref:hypothetical protein n=1 Tax=Bosea sp. (in: a-proteobacteria) TaxID=1871050 RepID=UPI002E11A4E6|nr:hypothetical protein [Bosea sp. (in: a-proteobacteria)]
MRNLLITALLLTPFSAAPAAAQALEGTWVGSTPRGSALSVTISGNQATSYYFQGRPQGITGGRVSGNRVSFDVAGPNKGKVVMTKAAGSTVSFRYTDNTGPDAMTTTLSRQ